MCSYMRRVAQYLLLRLYTCSPEARCALATKPITFPERSQHVNLQLRRQTLNRGTHFHLPGIQLVNLVDKIIIHLSSLFLSAAASDFVRCALFSENRPEPVLRVRAPDSTPSVRPQIAGVALNRLAMIGSVHGLALRGRRPAENGVSSPTQLLQV